MPYRSKDPNRTGWQKLRPTAADLDGLFPAGQQRNVGLLLGEPSDGLIDVDLDVDEAVAAAPLLLPPTGWVSGRAGRPRSHYWYKVPDPPRKASEKFLDLDRTDLLELRSTGGQTVVAPSAHEDTGEPLVWHTFDKPARVNLADLRSAVEALAAAALLARHWPAKGARHDARLALAGGLLRAGWTAEHTTMFLTAIATAAQNSSGDDCRRVATDTVATLATREHAWGWPKLEELLGDGGAAVVRQVRAWLRLSAARPAAAVAKKKVRLLEPYRVFPVAALPVPVAEYVRQGALALGCDPAYLALPALAVLASVIGNTRTLRLKRGWEEPLIVWSAIVGDSGTLKSPAYLKAVAHLFATQKRLVDDYRIAAEQYEEAMRAWETEKRKKDGDPGPRPEKPVLRRVVCSDTTIEKLAEILEDNPRGTLVGRDELAGWLGSFTRYKGKQGGTDLPNWLEMFRAGTVVVDRKTSDRPTLFIARAAVCVTGGIQPGVLARTLTADFLDAGLAARLLMVMPPKQPKRWSEVEVDPEVEQAYESVLDRLLALDFDSRDNERVPHVLKLSPEAKAAWVTFYDSWAKEQAAAEGELAAAFSKLEGYAARFALLHHVVTHVALDSDDRRPVGLRSIEAGVTLARWFAHEARRLYTILAESDDECAIRRLVEFIRARGGRMTVRQLMRANCRRWPDATAAETSLALLVDAGVARWVETATRMKGGQPIKAVELCMTHDSDDTAPIEDEQEWPDEGGSAHDTDADGNGRAPGQASQGNGSPELMEEAPGGVIAVMRHAADPAPTDAGSDAPAEKLPPTEQDDHVVMRPSRFAGRARGTTSPPYLLIRDPSSLRAVAAALAEGGTVGLDTETTGLDPRRDQMRLLSLTVDTIDGGRLTYLVDCFAVDPAPLLPLLAETEVVGHNLHFDLSMLWRYGYRHSEPLFDTMHVSRLLHAGRKGTAHTLDALADRHLGLELDKGLQKADWSGTLSEEMLRYAARDAAVVRDLLPVLREQLGSAGLEATAALEHRCLPGIVWLAMAGVPLDRGGMVGPGERHRGRARSAAGRSGRPGAAGA